jgi:hypothetical protein
VGGLLVGRGVHSGHVGRAGDGRPSLALTTSAGSGIGEPG